uniref:Pseudouridylate synthase RPUSD4, mitochondrial n=1 Tax=Sinocyclocheilus grahami TaxID=75366 RepID=A0A672PH25_SINGR
CENAPSYATASKTEAVASNGKTGLKAADIANRHRSEKEKRVPVSPLQNRVNELKQFTQQLQSVHTSVLAKSLLRGILYQDKNIIAINKPYGVPLHSEMSAFLAKITDGMQAGSQLHLCHSLEKENTGVLILAKTEEAAEHVQTLIRSHNVERKCLAVTVGVPVPSEGVIDIPIIEKEVTGPQPHFNMGLSPLFKVSEEGDGVTRVRAHRQAQSAVTQYRVLDSTSGCSLVELQPVTGVKNQLQVHMALALTCTILGDHKYAQWNKLAPQKLPEGILRRLGLDHPARGHSDITVSRPLPKYFTNTLKRLQIPLPGKE